VTRIGGVVVAAAGLVGDAARDAADDAIEELSGRAEGRAL
jgi:hypothetical protein